MAQNKIEVPLNTETAFASPSPWASYESPRSDALTVHMLGPAVIICSASTFMAPPAIPTTLNYGTPSSDFVAAAFEVSEVDTTQPAQVEHPVQAALHPAQISERILADSQELNEALYAALFVQETFEES